MAEAELIQALDYILNRSDGASIEVLAQAVIRRQRDIAMFGELDIPDPQRVAKDLSGKITAGIGASIEGMKRSVREMAMRVIKEQAPELSDEQIAELTRTWIPQRPEADGTGTTPPRDLLASMIEQFVLFSQGGMKESVDRGLRESLGAWPERYWNAFPPVVRLIITDFLKEKINEKEFNEKIGIILEME